MRFNKLDARAREHPSDAVKDELFSEAFESCRQDCMIGVRKREQKEGLENEQGTDYENGERT